MSSRFCFFLALAALAQTCLAAAPANPPDSRAAKILFREPPREYSTAPLWVWNDLLTEQEIRDTLRDLAAQKVKQAFIHPRPGLMTPYLGEDWFRLWKVALQEAKRLDMDLWIYDENSYPSGFAGGWVPEVMPESRGRGLSIKESKTAPAPAADLVAVCQVDGENCTNITAQVRAGAALPDGRYFVAREVRAGNSPWHGNRCYVNLLSPGVTEKFLELTLEPQRREFGSEFGRRVPGVFTDEPNIRPAGGLPWSEILASEFKKRWGYDLLDHLPSLTQPIGDWRKIRHNYFSVLNQQFIEHWARPYHDYCQSNHLEFTGHYWDHEWPHCVGVPDNMAMYAWHQRPAIDCLMNQYAENTHAQFGNLRMVRELSSIANQLGTKRTLCEIYGAGGWDLRFEDMKRIGDWLEVLGVNTLDQHLSYVTIRGARKRDHPQSFSYHEPWWDAYHISAEYFARLSAALSQGEQISPVLVLEPTTTAWMYQGDEAKLKVLGDSFFKLLLGLEAAQVEYDLGCEDVIARHGSAVTAGLKIGQRVYSTVVLPQNLETLDAATISLLGSFLEKGGQVLSCDPPPARLDGGLSGKAGELARSENWRTAEVAKLPELLGGQGLFITRQTNDTGVLFHHRRQLADGELLFLVNTSIDAPSAGTIESSRNSLEEWDLHTGNTRPFPFIAAGRGIKAHFQLPPCGSLLLFLGDQPHRPVPVPRETTVTLQPQGPPTLHRIAPNVLTLDFVDVTAGGETKSNLYFYPANQFVWKKNGLDRDPWDSAVQFKDELITKKFAADSGFSGSYRFQVKERVPPDLAIVVERPDLYTITCNGQPVRQSPGKWWLDKQFGLIPLAAAARVGENIVTLHASPFTMFHELEPAYVLGDFTLEAAEHGFTIGPAAPIRPGTCSESDAQSSAASNPRPAVARQGGWNEQGLPFYAAGVAYREQFDVPARAGTFQVFVPQWYGSVAKVSVNGKSAGYIDAAPWRCDVTQWIKRGRNEIEVTVIGTLKNTLGPHHGKPALGAAWPAGFQKGPATGPPPGAEYSTVAYGLFAPFVLEQRQPEPRSSGL